MVVAAIKVGYKTFLPSPRNSQAAFVSLLNQLECKYLVATTPEAPCVPLIEGSCKVEKLNLPSLQELLDSQRVPEYPYVETWEGAKDHPIFVLHTSGSTGIVVACSPKRIPKPLSYTNRFLTGIANNTALSPPDGFRSLDQFFRAGSFFMTLPSFHVAGIGFSLVVPAFHGGIPVYPLPTAPPTIQGIIEAVDNTELDWAFLPPVFVDELGKDPVLLHTVASRLKYVYYTGGSVPKISGDAVVKSLSLYQVMGSSECATFPLLRAADDETDDDWSYVQIHPEINAEFQHRFDDLHELVVKRRDDKQHYQPVFNHFPDLEEYHTRDLFSPHPTKPGMWAYQSRIDDVIVFLNGEKTNPVSFEQEVGRHPEIRAVLVGGQQRFEACLLIELIDSKILSEDEKQQTIDRIWPTVEFANASCPAHARLSRSRILLADPTMPFPRAGKGTIQRQATMTVYADAVERLYMEPDVEEPTIEPRNLDFSDREKILESVTELIKTVTKWNDLRTDDEFFAMGMDSLQVLQLNRALRSTFGLSTLALKDIYANPSLELLTNSIMHSGLRRGVSNTAPDRAHAIVETIQKYEKEIDDIALNHTNKNNFNLHDDGELLGPPRVILLTGSTGALGSFILNDLMLQDNIKHVYCLNRAHDSQVVQKRRAKSHGLSIDTSSPRITFITAELSAPNLGIEKSLFDEISSTTTEILHNAWPVDFNKTLQSFLPSLNGVMTLISFAAGAKLKPSLLFISSISSVINFQGNSEDRALVPEDIIRDPSCAANMGYGESKYIAERILDRAFRKLNVNSGILRVGQISGTAGNPRGWNRNEWFPSLALSSRYLGILPESLGAKSEYHPAGPMGDIDWVPVDRLAEVVVELSGALRDNRPSDEMQVFHAVNPQIVSWADILPTVQQTLGQPGQRIGTVPYSEWVDRLHSSSVFPTVNEGAAISEDFIFNNPGIKLLNFYESLRGSDATRTLARLDIVRTSKVSKSLSGLDPVNAEWVKGWIEGWLAIKPSI
ncbi:hypothetical protein LTR84_013032 [Exophiala bonariae]|uniref:Carrier domain-containing protein n=1 Tax=Exophiala bonariae TaxID=1690606 RepID=A0AAV9NDH0_9EURO|nr:hypothetical protein LTR84_013032 [Exophiala bonariae]